MPGYASLEQLVVAAHRRPSGLLVPPNTAGVSGMRVPLVAPSLANLLDLPMPHSGEPTLVVPTPSSSPAEDMLQCAVTPTDIDLPSPSLEEALTLIAGVPFEPAMVVLSAVAAELYHHGDDRRRQLALARQLFTPEMLRRIEAFVNEDESRLVFDPRHVAALQRLLIVYAAPHSEIASFSDLDVIRLGGALLAVSEALPHGDPPEPEDYADPDLAAWTAYAVRVGAWHSDPPLLAAIARARSLYVDVHGSPEMARHAARCDIQTWMSRRYGLTLDQQLAGGLACAVRARALQPDLSLSDRVVRIEPDFLEGGALAAVQEALVALISTTREQMTQVLTAGGQSPAQIAWDHTAFERWPFLRDADGGLRLISPRALAAWMTRGVHHRALQAAEQQPHPRKAGRTRSEIYLTYVGGLGEESTYRLVSRSHETALRAGAARIHREHSYYVGRHRHESPDIALDFGTELVLIEVCSGTISLAARTSADPTGLDAAVDKLVTKKLRELSARTLEVISGHLTYPGLALPRTRRIWRVLVLAGDPIMQTPLLWAYLRRQEPAIFDDDARMMRPILMNLDDLEPILAVVENGEHLPTLLHELLASPYAELPPRNWINERMGEAPSWPLYVREQWSAAIRAMGTTLFPESERFAAYGLE